MNICVCVCMCAHSPPALADISSARCRRPRAAAAARMGEPHRPARARVLHRPQHAVRPGTHTEPVLLHVLWHVHGRVCACACVCEDETLEACSCVHVLMSLCLFVISAVSCRRTQWYHPLASQQPQQPQQPQRQRQQESQPQPQPQSQSQSQPQPQPNASPRIALSANAVTSDDQGPLPEVCCSPAPAQWLWLKR